MRLDAGAVSAASQRLGATLVALWLLSGCVLPNTRPYPDHWPLVAKVAEGCPFLTGRYSNRSDRSTSGWIDLADLSEWILTGERRHVEPDAEVVDIDGPRDGVVALRLYPRPVGAAGGVGSEVGSSKWREGHEYSCEKGRLVLRRLAVEPALPAVVTSMSARLLLASDGSLVVERVETLSAVIPIPYYTSDSEWYLYKRLPGRSP